jgi:hypothetical protein
MHEQVGKRSRVAVDFSDNLPGAAYSISRRPVSISMSRVLLASL